MSAGETNDPGVAAAALGAVPGGVDTGLFLGTAERFLVGHADGRVEVLTRSERP